MNEPKFPSPGVSSPTAPSSAAEERAEPLRVRRRVLEELASVDARLAEEIGARASLSPTRVRATSLRTLAEQVLPEQAAPVYVEAFGGLLRRVAQAQRRHFPRTLFWDFDHLAFSVWEEAMRCPEPTAYLAHTGERLERVYATFGEHGPIRFRYAHDFLYGFDWAKWVKRRRRARSAVGPFHLPFLEYVVERGEQMLQLIDADDATYPRLRHRGFRNPFTFARAPDEERLLYRDLAARDLLPVRAWQHDRPSWDRPYEMLRVDRARVLGLERRSSNP